MTGRTPKRIAPPASFTRSGYSAVRVFVPDEPCAFAVGGTRDGGHIHEAESEMRAADPANCGTCLALGALRAAFDRLEGRGCAEGAAADGIDFAVVVGDFDVSDRHGLARANETAGGDQVDFGGRF